jgi:hypothetical protein
LLKETNPVRVFKLINNIKTSNSTGSLYIQGVTVANLNHSRPYLRFIDNLTREIGKDRSETATKKTETPERIVKHLNRLNSVALTDNEWGLLNDLFENISIYYSINIEIVDSLLKKQKKGKKEKLKQTQDECYETLVDIALNLFILERIEKNKGRKDGLQFFIDNLKIILEKNDQHDLWCLLTENVFEDALKRLATKLSALNV